ncbi:hypothetical protein SCBWM1_gp70 [Synechococcus phage S-CBWM1]|uniref:Uncharacterized protein n=1 Tax=Synechococcus phage S-CBWM1 TaxID=2053653 RepID=A0A3G1L3J0_9CAUD|nr:hypothetical protein HOU61_gp127 [Synechococcus phage S-CBWM1]ATW62754.1 hypothetical protein SCBWM1_gp70 [Synechococcus phage S-CBWM1]
MIHILNIDTKRAILRIDLSDCWTENGESAPQGTPAPRLGDRGGHAPDSWGEGASQGSPVP